MGGRKLAMKRIKDFLHWYKHLTSKGYGYIISIDYAFYNSKHYDRDGNYR
jgi:hypothetical protein